MDILLQDFLKSLSIAVIDKFYFDFKPNYLNPFTLFLLESL